MLVVGGRRHHHRVAGRRDDSTYYSPPLALRVYLDAVRFVTGWRRREGIMVFPPCSCSYSLRAQSLCCILCSNLSRVDAVVPPYARFMAHPRRLLFGVLSFPGTILSNVNDRSSYLPKLCEEGPSESQFWLVCPSSCTKRGPPEK